MQVEATDLGMSVAYGTADELVFDGKLDLIKAAILELDARSSKGFDLFLHSDAPPGSGLGSSSSVMVVLVGLLREMRSLPHDDYEVAHLAYVIERERLGISGGLQDQYAATFGGFNYIEFLPERVIVNPLKVSSDIVNELEYNLLLCYTGRTRLSAGIIDDQRSRYTRDETSTLSRLREIKALTAEMKNALLRRQFGAFGKLLHDEWILKKGLSSRISDTSIDLLYDHARRAGALGGKITGAGGGGYLLLYCDFEKKPLVAQRMRDLGCTIADFAFTQEGLQTWRVACT
jgi:D-glycero-alpha-D-manno-heptose-7-phosphate kinase